MINTTFADFVARTRHQSLTALVAWSYDLLDEALERARVLGDQSSIAAVLTGTAVWEVYEGQDAAARRHVEEAEALAISRQIGDAWRLGWALHYAGAIALARGDHPTARAYFEEKLAIADALADRSAIANTLTFLGQIAVEENAPSVARARFADALAIYRDRSDNTGIVWAAASLAESALADGEWDSARALAEESLAVSRDASIEQQAVALRCCGDAAFGECDVAAARRCFVEGLTLLGPSGRAGLTAQLRQAFARVAAARDQPDRALRLAGRAGAMRGWSGIRPTSRDRDLLERALAQLRAAPGGLTSDEQVAAWAEGEAMTPEQAAAYALEE